MQHQVDEVSVPKGMCMECPKSMDCYITLCQWQQLLRIMDPYHFVSGGEHNLLLHDRMSGNNTSHSNMLLDLTG